MAELLVEGSGDGILLGGWLERGRALEYCLDVGNINLSAIRTIRVLRPLRAINRIPKTCRLSTTIPTTTNPSTSAAWTRTAGCTVAQICLPTCTWGGRATEPPSPSAATPPPPHRVSTGTGITSSAEPATGTPSRGPSPSTTSVSLGWLYS
ncbi:hypothetical protein TNIN_274761 [Trichonephila inaurata madagascariensis]|uniref:Uncharacterized protein n=1 Tax=Trichonephila inaurata madagascariensis TaxID=2747483 RepID=A0A8X6X7F8_9ARAC|nr:hypothetical protein TNIN_274761 [Trichonephila inaurata madagascariensis]